MEGLITKFQRFRELSSISKAPPSAWVATGEADEEDGPSSCFLCEAPLGSGSNEGQQQQQHGQQQRRRCRVCRRVFCRACCANELVALRPGGLVQQQQQQGEQQQPQMPPKQEEEAFACEYCECARALIASLSVRMHATVLAGVPCPGAIIHACLPPAHDHLHNNNTQATT